MQLGFKNTLSGKLVFVVSTTIIVISIVFNLVLYINAANSIEDEMGQDILIKSELAADALRLPVWRLDHMIIESVVEAIMKGRDTVEIVLVDEIGNKIYSSSKVQLLNSEDLITTTTDIYNNELLIGSLEYVMTTAYEKGELRGQQVQSFLLLLVQMLIVIILIVLITNITLSPLKEMEMVAFKISSGDFQNTIKPTRDTELSDLREALLTMQSNLFTQQNEITNQIEELNSKNTELISANIKIEKLFKQSEDANTMLKQALINNDKAFTETVIALAKAVEACDLYTAGHCERVNDYSVAIGTALGFNAFELKEVHLAATLHDIGKIGIPSHVLDKPSGLTDEEYQLIKTHSSIGYEILNEVETLKNAAHIVLQHHERVDGKGYPSGLTGDAILKEAKIIAVVDSYDAMTSRRPYRKDPLSSKEAVQQLIEGMGSQFDETVVKTMIQLLEKGVIGDGI